jgi:aldehyde dehydrogenase (NAD+)
VSAAPRASLTELGLVRPQPGALRFNRFFAGGQWIEPTGDGVNPVYDCATEELLGENRSCSAADVAHAVDSAHETLPKWSAVPTPDRAALLDRVADVLAQRSVELASIIAVEVGTAARLSLVIQVNSAVRLLHLTADALRSETFEEQAANSTVLHLPVGVVAAITPWNYPLFQTVAKVAAALAAGCTVVHKPSELAPLSAVVLGEAFEQAGAPAGAYNLVLGPGPDVGELLVGNADVRMVSFTGSTRAGRRVYEIATQDIKRVALELGGKSASIALDDSDLAGAVKATVNRAFLNSGQTCDAWTRLLVPQNKLDAAAELAAEFADGLTVGDPFSDGTKLGPLISEAQRERAAGLVDRALDAGARLVTGGSARVEGFDRGHYFRPTVLTGVRSDAEIAQVEVFAPVLVVLGYTDEDEAVRLANDSEYGLSGAVWSANPDHARHVARQIQAGQVVINGGAFNPAAPFGGLKHSGLGREMGAYGIREFTETRTLQI